MISYNFYGMPYHMLPSVNSIDNIVTDETISGVKFIMFDGTIPSDDILYDIVTEADLVSMYTPLVLFNDITLSYTYNIYKKSVTFLNLPYNEFESIALSSGVISWMAIVFPIIGEEQLIYYTDMIGSIETVNSPIVVDNYYTIEYNPVKIKHFIFNIIDLPSQENI